MAGAQNRKVRQRKSAKSARAETQTLPLEIDGIRSRSGATIQTKSCRCTRRKDWQSSTSGQPGSHVIAHATKEELTPRAADAAARLAAWYSSANRGHGIAEAEVDTATVKGLRKAKGQGPGQVLYDSEGSFSITTKGPKTIDGLSDLNRLESD